MTPELMHVHPINYFCPIRALYWRAACDITARGRIKIPCSAIIFRPSLSRNGPEKNVKLESAIPAHLRRFIHG